jgi:hypothetical protein
MFRPGREMHEAPVPDLKKVFRQNQPDFYFFSFFFFTPHQGAGGSGDRSREMTGANRPTVYIKNINCQPKNKNY